jgi:hypothetical protein
MQQTSMQQSTGPVVALPQQPDGWLVYFHHPVASQVPTVWAPASEQMQQNDPTTLCIRNIPNNYTSRMILDLLNGVGFKNCYDFFYLPHDFKRLPKHANVGYFFVNFVSHEVAAQAWNALDGYKNWPMASNKMLSTSWATKTQGLHACIERYQNSPVMHRNVPFECKPMLFHDGEAIPMLSTKDRVKHPRYKMDYGYQGQLDLSVVEATIPPSQKCHDDEASTCHGGGSEDSDGKAEIDASFVGSPSDDTDSSLGFDTPVFDEPVCDVPPRHAMWMPDAATDACLKCTKPFTFLRRRHHCRACGLIFCAECAPRASNRAVIQGDDSPYKRVCMDCACGLGVTPSCVGTEVSKLASPKLTSAKPPEETSYEIRNTFVTIPRSLSVERLMHRPVTSFPL